MAKRPSISLGTRKHILTDRMKVLIAKALARKIGYLSLDDFPGLPLPMSLPVLSFNPNRIIRLKDELCAISHGSVEIWHARQDQLIATLETGRLFGAMPLLGQSMLGTQAISGPVGVTISVMDAQAVKAWIEPDPYRVLAEIGSRLSDIEMQHYRAEFQLADSRIAAVLLELAGVNSSVEGYTHEQIGERIGLYRETVTVVLDAMKADKLIEVGRRRIALLVRHEARRWNERTALCQ